MAKLIFFGLAVLGALIGVLSAADDGWGVRIVMAAIGALVGTAFGGGLARLVSRRPPAQSSRLRIRANQESPSPEDELVANFSRDRGHPPFAKPPEGLLPDRHVFDPDKAA